MFGRLQLAPVSTLIRRLLTMIASPEGDQSRTSPLGASNDLTSPSGAPIRATRRRPDNWPSSFFVSVAVSAIRFPSGEKLSVATGNFSATPHAALFHLLRFS